MKRQIVISQEVKKNENPVIISPWQIGEISIRMTKKKDPQGPLKI